MDLNPSPDQEMLRESARVFLAREWPASRVREMERDPLGYDPGIWRRVAELGWLGMTLPEGAGGGGRTFLDLALLLEETGRHLFASPLAAHAAVAAPLLERLAPRARWLPDAASGRVLTVLALAEPGWRNELGLVRLEARAEGDAVVLSGTKLFVPFAAAAHRLLVVARLGGASIIAVVECDAPGVRVERLATLDGGHRYEVALEKVRVRRDSCFGPADVEAALRDALRRGAVAALAEATGAAERVIEMTVEYAKTRVQFGRPIGSFQAVAHRCADMRADVDALRILVRQAAWKLSRGGDHDLEVGAARAFGVEALRRVAVNAHQVHGAIGFSTECDLQLFTRRMKAAELEWGGASVHRELVARAMGL